MVSHPVTTTRQQSEGPNAVEEKPCPPRILLAKIGLDGHDRGVKVLAREFRDAGIEVIYTGLWQTAEATMHAALQEDVDVVGVSLLSAAHMTVMPEILRIRADLGLEDIPVVLGGIVPAADYPKLKEMGIAEVFTPGSSLVEINQTLHNLASKRRAAIGHSASSGEELLAAAKRRDVRSLARIITSIQRGETIDLPEPKSEGALVVGITGAPGVGKSSFIGKLGELLRQRGKSIAVVAIDPTSPLTGGALLGDRLRMMSGSPGSDFFVRSLSSGTVQGGLAPHCRQVVDALRVFGFDFVLVETVGAGQGDVAIRELADQTLLLLMPDSGDAVQFSKAGIMEIVAGFVLNKCDLAGADATDAQLRGAVGGDRPIWRVSSARDEGIDTVVDWLVSPEAHEPR